MRSYLMEVLSIQGYIIHQTQVNEQDLIAADEVFNQCHRWHTMDKTISG